MKFTHQLKFNTVPEWRDHYIHYAALKKILYSIAKREQHEIQHGHEEDSHLAPLLPGEKAVSCQRWDRGARPRSINRQSNSALGQRALSRM